MAHVITKYIVYNHNGTGVRHHHFNASNNITSETDENYPGTTDNNPGSGIADGWPTLPFGGNNLPFAFMSINGAADGNHLYTSAGNQSFPVGASDVEVLVVYGPVGGIGVDGGPGIWVDAFNVNTGDFSDDLHFITILTPPTPPDTIDNGKTDFANSDGEVSSLSAEHIRASATIDEGVPFLEWKKIIPSESILNLKDFDMAQNETGEIWFAFYQSPRPGAPINLGKLKQYVAGGGFKIIIEDDGIHIIHGPAGGGGPGPVGPPVGPLRVASSLVSKLSREQKATLKQYQSEYATLTKSITSQTRQIIGVVSKVTKLLGI